jgi:hypothetical protein
MLKHVYNLNNGVVVLNEKIEGAEYASIQDLLKTIEMVTEKYQWENGNPILKFNEILFFSLDDHLLCKEDIFIWDKEKEEFVSVETIQSFDNPSSWKDDEKDAFAQILLLWISSNDHVYDLYEFLREMSDDESSISAASDYSLKLERLYHRELKNQDMLDDLEAHYQFRKEEYRKYKEGNTEEMLNADVKGGLN